MDNMKIISAMPEMLSGNELISALAMLPKYDANIRESNVAIRLMALSELYKIYVPSKMSLEIYSKLYLALLRSLQKKSTKVAIQQRNENSKAIRLQNYNGIVGGSDSFTIIGASGIGKSSAISRAIELITENRVIEVDKPYTKIIPCIVVQCPFDSSVKGLLLEILRKVDECLESNYYHNALKARATTDMLIGSVSQVAMNHVGLLIVDEIQNVVNSKNGKSLVGALTQLINNSGISIAMIGTPESSIFFEQAFQLARRSLGLQYGALEYGTEFISLCKILFSYQYVKNNVELTDDMIGWLYEHSSGIVSIVVSLIHDAQEIAMLNGSECLDMVSLNEAYKKRLSMLHTFIEPTIKREKQTSQKKNSDRIDVSCPAANIKNDDVKIADLVIKAKDEKSDIVEVLREHITIEEVAI